jgi:hypothetical protein
MELQRIKAEIMQETKKMVTEPLKEMTVIKKVGVI